MKSSFVRIDFVMMRRLKKSGRYAEPLGIGIVLLIDRFFPPVHRDCRVAKPSIVANQSLPGELTSSVNLNNPWQIFPAFGKGIESRHPGLLPFKSSHDISNITK